MYLHYHEGNPVTYDTDCPWQYTEDMPCPACREAHRCGPCPTGGRDA